MDDLENKFSQSQSLLTLVWFRYIDDVFFICTHGNDKLEKHSDDLNSFDNNSKFTPESSRENVTFLDLIVNLSKGRLTIDLHIKIQIDTSIFTSIYLIQIYQKIDYLQPSIKTG